MANEEKILEMLGELKADMDAMKADIEAIKRSENGKKEIGEPMPDEKKKSLREALQEWYQSPYDEESERFFQFMDAEEARKAALYGE